MNFDRFDNLETERLYFFQLTSAHVSSDYVGWLNDPEINQFLESRHSEQTLTSVCSFVENAKRNPKEFFFGIYSKPLEKHIGNIRIHMIDLYHGTAEVGILIGEKTAWGRGYASEALILCSQFCRNTLKLRKLTAGCYGANIGSKKAFLKAGYEVEAVRKQQYRCAEGFEDLVLMGIVF